MKKIISITVLSLFLAGASGFAVSSAIGQGDPSAPTKTVVITLKNGDPGPPGPPGPKGDTGASGEVTCPNGFENGEVVINHPGGQVTIFGCIK